MFLAPLIWGPLHIFLFHTIVISIVSFFSITLIFHTMNPSFFLLQQLCYNGKSLLILKLFQYQDFTHEFVRAEILLRIQALQFSNNQHNLCYLGIMQHYKGQRFFEICPAVFEFFLYKYTKILIFPLYKMMTVDRTCLLLP